MLGKMFFGKKRDSLELKAEKARDTMFGAMDGMIDTIATIAGVAGATSSNFIVLVAGLSTLVAEAAAMGFSSYQSTKIKEEILETKRKKTNESPLMEGLLYWAATLGGGFVILIPFILDLAAPLQFSAGVAAVLLFVLGWKFTKLAKRNPWRGALETAGFGLFAAGATFLLGSAIAGLAG